MKVVVDETSSGLYLMVVVGITYVKLSGSAACQLLYTRRG
jgi:hypothetical protein